MTNEFAIQLTTRARQDLKELKKNKVAFKAVSKALNYMATNIKHPSLHTHEFRSRKGQNGEKVFESYAQNKTPGAYRIFWHYGPADGEILVVMITFHP